MNSTRWFLVSVATALVAGCSEEAPAAASLCGVGTEVSFEGDTFCVYSPIIIEGFNCPAGLLYSYGSEPGPVICAAIPNLEMAAQNQILILAGLPGSFAPDKIAVDILLLVDSTPSMCQEQPALADGLETLVRKLNATKNIDYRVAVVTQDMLSGSLGAFQAPNTKQFPFACSKTEIQACLRPGQSDVFPHPKILSQCVTPECDCSNLGPEWTCETLDTAKKALNCNGTINSQCRRGCLADSECHSAFVSSSQGETCAENPAKCLYQCLSPSNEATQTGCVLRANTVGCPDSAELRQRLIEEAPTVCDNGLACTVQTHCSDGSECSPPTSPWLTSANAEQLLRCLAIVGTVQATEATLEQGFNALYYALSDKAGAGNRKQAQGFLRDDAYLWAIVVTDEDDCSAADCDDHGDHRCGDDVRKEDYGKCTCLADTTEGGPLLSVSDAVLRMKSLKKDPDLIRVAVISGDSVATDESQKAVDRTAYRNSKCRMCEDPADDHPALENTYICSSPLGKADYGGRYAEFVGWFRENGIYANICADEGIEGALDDITNTFVKSSK